MKILVVHGPNLNLLGSREPDHYGALTLSQINDKILSLAKQEKAEINIFQANSEGEIIAEIHRAIGMFDGILINPAAYTHTSVALRDALTAAGMPIVEVHLSNIFTREDFRKISLISDIAVGVVAGFKEESYLLGLQALLNHLRKMPNNE